MFIFSAVLESQCQRVTVHMPYTIFILVYISYNFVLYVLRKNVWQRRNNTTYKKFHIRYSNAGPRTSFYAPGLSKSWPKFNVST